MHGDLARANGSPGGDFVADSPLLEDAEIDRVIDLVNRWRP
jgi:hypothetical protein